MTIKPQQFTSVPVRIEAIRVTAENMDEVAKWCEGEIRIDSDTNRPYIKVDVFRPMTKRQTQAYAGDWVTISRTGNKVYLHQSFRRSFIEVVSDEKAAELLQNIFSEVQEQRLEETIAMENKFLHGDNPKPTLHICDECENAAPGDLCVNLKAELKNSIDD